jgi:hypothetical protein
LWFNPFFQPFPHSSFPHSMSVCSLPLTHSSFDLFS